MIINFKNLKPTSTHFLSQRSWRYLRNIIPSKQWTFFYIYFQKLKQNKLLNNLNKANLKYLGPSAYVRTNTDDNVKNIKLSDILKKYSTSKPDNGYLDYLDEISGKLKNIETILEIGIAQGSGVYAYLEFFEKANIVGLDIDENTFFQNKRLECYKADQLDRKNLKNVANKINKFYDLIIDDGWHHPEAQINSIIEFLPYLKIGGIMIVEDIVNSEYFNFFNKVQKILNNKNFQIRYINFSKPNVVTPYGMSGVLEIKRFN